MGWLRRLFGMEAICLSTAASYWEVDGPKTFEELFNALKGWVLEDAVLYCEGGSPDAEIDSFVAMHSVPAVSHVARGTIWPPPKVFHLPATATILTKLAGIMKHHAEPELAVHFHIYRNDSVLLEWHDAFSQPILMSGVISEDKIKGLADKIAKNYRKIVERGAPSDVERRRR